MKNVRLIYEQSEMQAQRQLLNDRAEDAHLYHYDGNGQPVGFDVMVVIADERGDVPVAVLGVDNLRDSLAGAREHMLREVDRLYAVMTDLADAATIATVEQRARRIWLETWALEFDAGAEAAHRARLEAVAQMSDDELAALVVSRKAAAAEEIPF